MGEGVGDVVGDMEGDMEGATDGVDVTGEFVDGWGFVVDGAVDGEDVKVEGARVGNLDGDTVVDTVGI